MFGDNEAYFNKFMTCVRTRPRESQKLGNEFYEQEHSKPLFNDNNLLTVYQLYKYHCTLEMFKIVKLRLPISLYSLFNMSNRRENYFITPNPAHQHHLSINLHLCGTHAINSHHYTILNLAQQ